MNRLKWKLRDLKYNIKRSFKFFENVWLFRKALWSYDWYDNSGILYFMKTCLKDMSSNIATKGIEVEEYKFKKVYKINRAIELLNNYLESNYIEIAEKELGKIPERKLEFERCPDKPEYYQLVDNRSEQEREFTRKVFNRSNEIEEQEWDELFEILKGKKFNAYYDQDGSGIKTWWD